jgi:hypothetical protein
VPRREDEPMAGAEPEEEWLPALAAE